MSADLTLSSWLVLTHPVTVAHPEEPRMFERFTDQARRAIKLAESEARTLNHDTIGTEHLLLGLIHEGEGVAGQALHAAGADATNTRQVVHDARPPGEHPPHGHIPFTSQTKKALEQALREALQLGHNFIATEHLLLAIIHEVETNEANDVARAAFLAAGIDPATLRQQVLRKLADSVKRPDAARKTPEHPARVKPQPHCTELTYVVEDGIDPLELRNLVDNIHHSLIHGGMPGTRITGLSLTDHTLRVVVS